MNYLKRAWAGIPIPIPIYKPIPPPPVASRILFYICHGLLAFKAKG